MGEQMWQGPGQTKEDTQKKAQLCVDIARRTLGNVSEKDVEDLAVQLMKKSPEDLEAMRQELEPAPPKGKGIKAKGTKDVSCGAEVRFEELSPAAVKGLDNFRAWMKAEAPRVFYEEGTFWIEKNREKNSIWTLPGIVHGFILSAGATFDESVLAMRFAGWRQHNYWMKSTEEQVPPDEATVDYHKALGLPPPRSQTKTTWKFIG